jgi:hypothetical protein
VEAISSARIISGYASMDATPASEYRSAARSRSGK